MSPQNQSAALALLLATSAAPGHAMTVTGATPYWTTSIQAYGPHTPGYSSREAAATGGVTYWCAMPENRSVFLSCSYGGIDSRDNAIAKTEYGNFAIATVYQYPVCPVGTQMYSSWPYNGVTYTPACVNWAEPPPPRPPKPVVIDPGHGFHCALKRLPPGAVGVTDFPPSDPPPGRLQEDALAWAVAKELQRQLPASRYKAVLTKANANECPSFRERGRVAMSESAKAFISIHMNAPNVVLGIEVPFANGTSTIYNSGNPGALKLAEILARSVSSSLGVNNRGVKVDNGLTVLKPEVTPVNAVLLEAARLSGRDELILHASDSAARIAAGIKAALDAELQD